MGEFTMTCIFSQESKNEFKHIGCLTDGVVINEINKHKIEMQVQPSMSYNSSEDDDRDLFTLDVALPKKRCIT